MPNDKKDPTTLQSLSIIKRVEAIIRDNHLVNENGRLIVAVSGGSDSLALLYLLRAISFRLQLVAVYIDHQLRPLETPLEQQTITKCCNSLNIPFVRRIVDIQQLTAREKHSPEEAARILRYRALEEVRREHDAHVIATGHTADDQVEEFFLRLIRGSSRRGLSGMAVQREQIIRPLLYETKDSLADYLTALGVEWCLDSSNLERHFLRNRVRLDLLPLLEKEFNPSIRQTTLQSMNILEEEEDFLESRTAEAFMQCVDTSQQLPEGKHNRQLLVKMTSFDSQHLAIRRRILEKCFWQMGIRPSYKQINTLVEFVNSGGTGRELHLEDGVRAEKHRTHLLLCRPLERGRIRGSKTLPPGIHLAATSPGRYKLESHGRELILEEMEATQAVSGDGSRLFVDKAKITFPLLLRSALPGEKFHPFNSPGKKKVSRYFNDQKIPPIGRNSWPVLLAEDKIIALPGLQIDHHYRVSGETREILAISWLKLKTINS